MTTTTRTLPDGSQKDAQVSQVLATHNNIPYTTVRYTKNGHLDNS